jgi:hypothetical protein
MLAVGAWARLSPQAVRREPLLLPAVSVEEAPAGRETKRARPVRPAGQDGVEAAKTAGG